MSEHEKQLKIKINCVKRLTKECEHYNNEIKDLNNKICQMTEEDPDNYDIKKKEEIVSETKITKKFTEKMLQKYTEELQELLNKHLEIGNISEDIIEEINSI